MPRLNSGAMLALLGLCLKGIAFGFATIASALVAANGYVACVAMALARMINATLNVAFNAVYNVFVVCHI